MDRNTLIAYLRSAGKRMYLTLAIDSKDLPKVLNSLKRNVNLRRNVKPYFFADKAYICIHLINESVIDFLATQLHFHAKEIIFVSKSFVNSRVRRISVCVDHGTFEFEYRIDFYTGTFTCNVVSNECKKLADDISKAIDSIVAV